jgi:hypothetical protein
MGKPVVTRPQPATWRQQRLPDMPRCSGRELRDKVGTIQVRTNPQIEGAAVVIADMLEAIIDGKDWSCAKSHDRFPNSPRAWAPSAYHGF